MPGIVVGVDGSDHSRRALIWAMRQAAQQQVPLTVLAVRPDPVRPVTGVYWGVHAYPEDTHNREVARKAIQEMVEQVRNDISETVPRVTVNVVTGDPAEELVQASRGADMVVVGSRGSGGFASLLMGSVSSKVTHHAACPVVVIRGEGQPS
jgi:nucleotide-binding universal stress UspA family protein